MKFENVKNVTIKAGNTKYTLENARALKDGMLNSQLYTIYNVFASLDFAMHTGKTNGWWQDGMEDKYIKKAAKEGIKQNTIMYQMKHVMSAKDFYNANKALVKLAGVKWSSFGSKNTVFYGVA